MDTKDENLDPFVGFIRERFQQAETARLYDEKRWLKAYRNYRGLYGPEMAFRDNEKSKVFVKITKTKVLAAFGQIIEVLFSSGKFPIGVRPTTVPEGIDEYAHIKPGQAQQQQANGQAQPQQPNGESPYGFPGDGGGKVKNVNRWREQIGLYSESNTFIDTSSIVQSSALGDYELFKIK